MGHFNDHDIPDKLKRGSPRTTRGGMGRGTGHSTGDILRNKSEGTDSRRGKRITSETGVSVPSPVYQDRRTRNGHRSRRQIHGRRSWGREEHKVIT